MIKVGALGFKDASLDLAPLYPSINLIVVLIDPPLLT